jgi:putative oxidoreductase
VNEAPRGWRRWPDALAGALERWIPLDSVLLVARLGIGAVFLMSGRTKVDGDWNVTDGAIALFRDEYKLPLVDPALAAHAAAYAEHALPILLALGLLTRISALGLLAMTAVIEIFVYPDAWPTHLTWAAPLLLLAARGGGRISLDRAIGIR